MAAYRYSGLNPKKISDIRGLAAIRMDISYKLHENVSSLLSITGLTGHGLVRQFLHRLAKGPHTYDPKTDNACRPIQAGLLKFFNPHSGLLQVLKEFVLICLIDHFLPGEFPVQPQCHWCYAVGCQHHGVSSRTEVC